MFWLFIPGIISKERKKIMIIIIINSVFWGFSFSSIEFISEFWMFGCAFTFNNFRFFFIFIFWFLISKQLFSSLTHGWMAPKINQLNILVFSLQIWTVTGLQNHHHYYHHYHWMRSKKNLKITKWFWVRSIEMILFLVCKEYQEECDKLQQFWFINLIGTDLFFQL